VGANRQTILNSDPVLDFGEVARNATPRLRSCLSAPIVADDALVGVITLYSSQTEQFTEEHRRLIETLAHHLAPALKRALARSEPRTNDPVTGLPYFAGFANAPTLASATRMGPDSLIFWIDIVGLKQINSAYGRSVGNAALCQTARCIESQLQNGDHLFRYESDEFIAVLNSTDMKGALMLARRVNAKLQESQPAPRSSRSRTFDVLMKCVSAPADLSSLGDVLDAATDIRREPHSSSVH
jgi:diguanylate cyclase (GGDEF)-like protein